MQKRYAEDRFWDSMESFKAERRESFLYDAGLKKKNLKILLDQKLLSLSPKAHTNNFKIQGNGKEQQGIQVFI